MAVAPSPESLLENLAKCLAEIKVDPRHNTTTPEGALYVSREALHVVIQTLDELPRFKGIEPGQGLTKPLWDLQIALLSIHEGVSHPMLTPPKVGKRVKSVEHQALMGWASVLFDCLQKEGATRNEAGKAVAKELTMVKLSQGPILQTPTAKTVEGWVNKLREGPGGAPASARIIWLKYIEGRAQNPQVPEPRWVVWARMYLSSLIAERLILQSPPKKVEY